MEPAVNPVALRNVTIFTDVQHSSNTITVLKLNEILWKSRDASAPKPPDYRYFCATEYGALNGSAVIVRHDMTRPALKFLAAWN
jgi:hypothetical protein